MELGLLLCLITTSGHLHHMHMPVLRLTLPLGDVIFLTLLVLAVEYRFDATYQACAPSATIDTETPMGAVMSITADRCLYGVVYSSDAD